MRPCSILPLLIFRLKRIPQLPPQDLPGSGFGNGFDDLHAASESRVEVDFRVDELLHFLHSRCVASALDTLLEDDECPRDFAAELVGNSDHRRIGDRRMRQKDSFQLGWRNLRRGKRWNPGCFDLVAYYFEELPK